MHLGGGRSADYTLEFCNETAIQTPGANVFNWKDGACFFKKCDNIEDVKPTTQHGGYNVYVLKCEG